MTKTNNYYQNSEWKTGKNIKLSISVWTKVVYRLTNFLEPSRDAPVLYQCAILEMKWGMISSEIDQQWSKCCHVQVELKIICKQFSSCFFVLYVNQRKHKGEVTAHGRPQRHTLIYRLHLRPGADISGMPFLYQVMLGFGKPFRASHDATWIESHIGISLLLCSSPLQQ